MFYAAADQKKCIIFASDTKLTKKRYFMSLKITIDYLRRVSIQNYFSAIFLLASLQVYSQPSYEPGSWLMGTSTIRLNQKFGLHAEAQYRDHGIFNEVEQILLRGGVNFHYNPNLIFTAGYGNISGHLPDREYYNKSINEHRLWEQVILRNTMGRLITEHRYRLEQRWISTNKNNSYQDRMRYCLRLTVPINKSKLEERTFFISVYDEIFINFNKNPFDRNRAYAAIGYQFTPLINVQAGYLAQTVNIQTKQFLQLALFYNLNLFKGS